jgi:hypothetical protein
MGDARPPFGRSGEVVQLVSGRETVNNPLFAHDGNVMLIDGPKLRPFYGEQSQRGRDRPWHFNTPAALEPSAFVLDAPAAVLEDFSRSTKPRRSME